MANEATLGAAQREPAQDLADLLQRGKDEIDDDPDKAVELLSEAVRAFEKHYGSDSLECAGPYLYYGIALYEVARNATDALGGTKSEATKPAAAPAAGDAGPSSDGAAARPQPTGVEGDFRAAVADDEAGGANSDDNDADADEKEEGGDGDKESEDKEGGEGSPTNDDMKLAWEMLELARLRYNQHQPEQHASKLAEVHKTLGDILAEQEGFEQAAAAYRQSLAQLEAMQPRSTRRIAEVQYKLSLMLTFMDEPKEALKQTLITMAALEAAVAEIEGKLSALPADGSGGEAAEEEGAALQATADDLRAVMDELRHNCQGLRETIGADDEFVGGLKGKLAAFYLQAGAGADAAGPSAGGAGSVSAETNSFGAAPKPASALQPVSLGVVGRGTKRITLQPAVAAAAGAEQRQPAAGQAPAKRTLADLMGGAPGGAVGHVTGADGPSTAAAEGETEAQQPTKKARAEGAD
ncbi:NASP-related protein sim3 [Tetrabaena socialis]|uniref:NASP-related protein sim3 n=1 Tax=Tetrabaena socialis TaxID=47790 RepID=A0A2J8ACH4_9CHLO|nr:NASP-related protein sim3 [Tetrabaena socialis]|eukprot:PNH10225.1 NASP-related protein sim3 [Tetrabaena socialis]